MFELAVARKYLIPRVRQLSVSIISLISVFVIATVVWLSIVFFSAQEGIEKSWTEKMVALTSPIRLTPTQEYYKSYYYQIDAYSQQSNFSHKSLRQKLTSAVTNPYNPAVDPALPPTLAKDDSVDILKATATALNSIPQASWHIFETAQANLMLRLIRPFGDETGFSEQELKASCYLMNFNDATSRLKSDVTAIHEHGIVLPKSFKEAGVAIGDSGYLSYQGFGITSAQEMRSKVTVEGFYDPGILPIGGRVALVSQKTIETILSASFSDESNLPTGIGVDIKELSNAHNVKEMIAKALESAHLQQYWNIQTYDEFDFTKDIFQQMRSDKNLFSLISCIIIIVACSNIISMLIILVHDKRKEVAILRALGASKASIAFIFGLCGFILGAIGSIIGALFAVLTLHNLPTILGFLGSLQGFEVLSSAFYANSLPTTVSVQAMLFVISLSGIASCIAGIIPAISACRINSSEALRNE